MRFPFPQSARYERLAKAVWSGAAARLVTTAAGMMSISLTVRYLGGDRYGLWATVAGAVMWVNLLDLGVANALTNNLARAHALDDRLSAAQHLTNALLMTGSMAVVAGLTFAVGFRYVNWMRLLNVGAAVPQLEVRHFVAAAIGLLLAGLPGGLAGRVLAGYQELHRYNFVTCAGAITGLLALALGMIFHVSMPLLFILSAGCLPLASLTLLVRTIGWSKPWLRPRLLLSNKNTILELLSSGWAFFLIQISAVVVYSSDNLIVSHYLGPAEVTPYSVTWRLASLAAVVQSLLFPALWPAYAEAHARRDYNWVRRTFTFTLRGTVVFNAASAVLLVSLGKPLIRLWAGPVAVPSAPLLVAMAVWILVSGFMSVESCLLAALNRTRAQAVLSIVAAALNVTLSITLVQRVGSLGVIAGTILSYLFVLVVPQSILVRNLLREGCRASQPEAPFESRRPMAESAAS